MVYLEIRRRESSLPLFDDVDSRRVIHIERTEKRGNLLYSAAGFHPSQTAQGVLREFANDRAGHEVTPENLDEFLLEYVRQGVLKARAESVARAYERANELRQTPVYFGKKGRSRHI